MNIRVPRESIAQWHHPVGCNIFTFRTYQYFFCLQTHGSILTNFSRVIHRQDPQVEPGLFDDARLPRAGQQFPEDEGGAARAERLSPRRPTTSSIRTRRTSAGSICF